MYLLLVFILTLCHATYFAINRILMQGLKKLLNNQPEEDFGAAFTGKVSVLISVRNEEKLIGACLDALLAQDYPRDKTEIVLVNDRSTDSTGKIMETYYSNHPGLFKVVNILPEETSLSPKKFALKKGIQQCAGEIILSTDADCVFNSGWVSSMVSHFEETTGMVLGSVTYYKDPSMNQVLWGVQAVEFFSHTVVSSSLVANKFPINANANNMAYRKNAFEQAGCALSHEHIVSGDDDFLMQEIAALKNWEIKFSLDKESRVQTRPSTTIKQIWEQRKRWASKCSLYGKKQVAFLSFIYFYYTLILILLISGLFSFPLFLLGIISWLTKTAVDYSALKLGARLFSQEKLLQWFLPAAGLHIPLIVFAVLFGSFGKFTWKGQTVRKKV